MERMAGGLSRRLFLKGSVLAGCSAAAHPWMSSVTLAAAPWENRLVVIILRGAMDGLDVVQPLGDADFARLRPDLGGQARGAIDLDGFYAMHPALAGLMPMWQAGQLGFVHATSTPYRGKRSHFDGQDLLEAGTGFDLGESVARDGWLNRMLQVVPGVTGETSFAIGRDEMKVLHGPAPHQVWMPDTKLVLSAQSRLLLEAIYHDDPLFRDSALAAMTLTEELAEEEEAMGAEDMAADEGMAAEQQAVRAANPKAKPDPLASFAAERLRADTRIATFSLSGWDTHKDQARGLAASLGALQNTLLTLQAGLGPVWGQTTVLAMTEFGRTARQNGTGGTDHGTGGAMLLAGGAVRGGRVHGSWPGLSEAALYERRDLLPTSDVRAHAAWVMRGLFGLDRSVLEGSVFPGLDLGQDAGLLL